jgi:hypothetical protein
MKLKIIIFVAFFLCLGLVLTKAVTAKDEPNTPPGLENKPPLEKKVFIHYRQGYGKPDGLPNAAKVKDPSCYGFLSKGMYWKTLPQGVVLDTANDDGLAPSFVEDAVGLALNEWDRHTNEELFSGITSGEADWDGDTGDQMDNRNEILFGSYLDPNVIAVTAIWGYYNVPPKMKEILEFDILFNEAFAWGNGETNPSLMDLQNIATHELGHGLGMDDLYINACEPVTMFGYSDYGDIDKRTLEPADITGFQKLYGWL